MWVSEGEQASPSSGDILATTGALGTGVYTLTLLVWVNTGDADLEIAQRNALNSDDVNVQRLHFSGGSTFVHAMPFTLVLNQRVVVRARSNISGDIQVSLLG